MFHYSSQSNMQTFMVENKLFVGPAHLKEALCENINKKVCFLDTESLVLDIACKDLRNELRSKDMKKCRHRSSQTVVFLSVAESVRIVARDHVISLGSRV